MNFDLGEGYSVILMSVHPNAPYRDRFEDDATTLIYEGHDASRTRELPDPKSVDQPEFTPSGRPTENGKFYSAYSWREPDGRRTVFRFKLAAVESTELLTPAAGASRARRRMIPTSVKMEVWKRDGGKCVMCGAADELHFDHDLPYSLGGTSVAVANVQLLCRNHNLSKGAKIL